MENCLKCNSAIDEDSQYYNTSNMGPDIIAIVEQNLGCEIDFDGALCSHCFEDILLSLSHPAPRGPDDLASGTFSPLESDENDHQGSHDTNVCIWCRSSLYRRCSHSLLEGPERDFIASRISPRIIPEDGLLCYACWVHARRSLENQGIRNPPPANTHACVWCRRSLVRTRRHSIPEGPERTYIMSRIYPRQIPPGGQVCYACWVAARRNVQRDQNVAERPSSSHTHSDEVCAWCTVSLHRRQTHILSGSERDEVAARIYPRELPSHALVCTICWTRAQQNVHIEQGEIDFQVTETSMSLDDFKHTTSSSAHCFVPTCTNTERLRVPAYLRKRILKSQKIFVTENSRICAEHITFYNWEFLDQQQFSNTFTKVEMESMLRLSIEEIKTTINFQNVDEMEDHVFRFWTGVTKENYFLVLNIIGPALTCKAPKTALGAFLIKCRTGDSHERLASLLHLSKSSITRLLNAAREALTALFVPLHLGVNRLSRDNIINRNLIIPEGLFGNREERVPIVICDGTYIYLQKSSNYLFQKKTYSLHKYRNLVKPFLIVATDGHILDIFGPYPATESDADIIKALFQNENEALRTFFRENDVFILDRGFRDSISFLESLGYKIYKPETLEAGETQLPTLKANKSRCVTLCRWVVEVVNGRIKRDFKLFRQEYFNVAATHLMEDLRICAAIINAFHPEIVDRPDAEIILNRALQRINIPNELGQLIISNRINRYRAQFRRIDTELPELDTFPQMTMEDLIIFALGTYQIKQARSYYGEHLREHGSFEVEISDSLEVITQGLISSHHDTVLIRGRIKSRHHSGKIYYCYILLANHGSHWDDTIIGYYCSCVAGQRTVGCCAHTMTIVWYLGWARHQDNINAPATFLDGILIRDDVENEDD